MKKTLYMLLLMMLIPTTVYAMHISEGLLPPMWAAIYFVISAPFLYMGIRDIRKKTDKDQDMKMLLGLIAAFCFVLSALKLPSISGSSSHPTGTGFGAILFGPYVMSVVGFVVLVFQALFLGHGGITTLGANTFSMAIAGPVVSYLTYRIIRSKNKKAAIFTSAALGNMTTYMVTSLQLAFAFPSNDGGILASFFKFASIFALTQLPLAIVEGLLTVVIFNFIEKHSLKEINALIKEV
jgi:cobalt/nickel transport system permease protein